MKIIVWGTGAYYQYYKKYLDEFEFRYIVDNNKSKNGMILDGKKVCSPNEVDFEEYDYVVILVKGYPEIEKQLLTLNVPQTKIISYLELRKIIHREISIESSGTKVILKDWLKRNIQKRILLVSHELSYTGVPIALMNLAILLKKMGYAVLYISMQDGKLSEELKKNKIDFIGEMSLFIQNQDLKRFDLCILGTAALKEVLPFFLEMKKPIMWWMHETDSYYYKSKIYLERMENVCFYAGGSRVEETIKKYWKIRGVKQLLYFLPEKEIIKRKEKKDKVSFAMIGTYCERKAQDILTKAVRMIPKNYKENYEIIFVGSVYSDKEKQFYDMLKTEYPENLYLDEMNQEELEQFFEKIDVLVCPSRDDPMPIVVSQAMQYRIPCVVSTKVGQAEFIEDGKNGFVFNSEEYQKLAEKMIWILDNVSALDEIGNQGRKIFEEHFSEEHMKNEIIPIINEKI